MSDLAAPITPAEGPSWLLARRERVGGLVHELPLPGPKSKGWEFTDISQLEVDAFRPVTDGGDAGALERAATVFEAPEGAVRLDQVDAVSLDGAGSLPEQPDRPVVCSLEVAVARWPELVEAHFGQVVSEQDPFVARNEAGWRGGAFVYVPSGQRLEAPALLTVAQATAGSSLSWRTLVVLEDGAEAEVWEQYLSAGEDMEALFNTVVELRVGDGANLRFVSGQGLSERSWVFGAQRAEVGRDASLDWVALGFGSARGKVRMETKLAGRGSSARVTGAYAAHGRQHIDFDTLQEHAAEHTTSDLAFRGILTQRATAVWGGMIRVDPGAQRTDAFQESRNLLLSRRAHADAIPGLEIEANDVRCTHAAAVAQIDPEQLYYLRARGLPEEVAHRMIVDGFLQALVERFPAGTVHDGVSAALERRLEAVLGA